MLVCTTASYGGPSNDPAQQSSMGKARPPRVISEVRKCRDSFRDYYMHFRAKISADLLVLLGSGPRWLPRRVQVRAGQLLLSPVQGCLSLTKSNDLGIRIPLRHLSLQAGPTPFSLAIVRGQTILLTLQTSNEHQFDLWVQSIAMEIIRQTPLEDVKYLDVLTLASKETTRSTSSSVPKTAHSVSFKVNQADEVKENIGASSASSPGPSACGTCKPVIHFAECDVNKNIISVNNKNMAATAKAASASTVEGILKKCQSSENYVPVKEKLVLFESLCRIGRGCSSEDVSQDHMTTVQTSKRARSLHDLTYCFTSGGVREICKYFETKFEDGGSEKVSSSPSTRMSIKQRLIHSDSSLHKVPFNRNFENVSFA